MNYCYNFIIFIPANQKRVMKKFFAGAVYCLLYVAGLLPLCVHYFFSGIFAFILRKIVRYRYPVIVTNIARSFPDMKYPEIKALAKK